MALNIKQLNSDASFLLSFEPNIPLPSRDSIKPRPFTILLDPWITGPTLFLSKSARAQQACITSLSDLPELDLVVISQHKSDHCNEATLRQLPASGKRPLILAEPSAARLIRSWHHFDSEKVVTLERWEDPRLTGRQTVVRIAVPRVVDDGQEGEVTISFIPQRKKRDPASLHGAIGITYRPPSIPSLNLEIPAPIPLPQAQLRQQQKQHREQAALATPPTTPDSNGDSSASRHASTTISISDTTLRPPSPPVSPRSLRSVQSAATLMSRSSTAPQPQLYNPDSPNHIIHQRMSSQDLFKASSHREQERPHRPLVPYQHRTAMARPLSVVFSPHGISYADLAPYTTSHLVSEAALPLTALLHCMDSVASPPLFSIGQWFSSNNDFSKGDICAGTPTGAEIAGRLAARVWVSAHDSGGDTNEVHGLAASGMLRTRTRRFARDEVLRTISRDWEFDNSRKTSSMRRNTHTSSGSGNGMIGGGRISSRGRRIAETEAIRLGGGDELEVRTNGVAWSSAGVGDWEVAGEKKETEREKKRWEKEKNERIKEKSERKKKDGSDGRGPRKVGQEDDGSTTIDVCAKTQGEPAPATTPAPAPAFPTNEAPTTDTPPKKQSLRTKASRIGFGIRPKS